MLNQVKCSHCLQERVNSLLQMLSQALEVFLYDDALYKSTLSIYLLVSDILDFRFFTR